MDLTVVIAIVAAAVVAGLMAGRLQRMAKRNRPDPASEPLVTDSTMLSTSDQRFRLMSFQGGSVPADLAPVLEELRRNGIEVDEETLRQKLADGATNFVDFDGSGVDLDAVRARGTRGTALVIDATDVAGGEGLTPNTVPVQVTLELRIPGREPIRERRVALISGDHRALLAPGASVPVRYDPDDPRAMTLEWEIT
jgi:hypothetical protein